MPIELLYDADRTLTGDKEFIIKLLKIIRVIYKYRKKIKWKFIIIIYIVIFMINKKLRDECNYLLNY
jgi:hypothetical protein